LRGANLEAIREVLRAFSSPRILSCSASCPIFRFAPALAGAGFIRRGLFIRLSRRHHLPCRLYIRRPRRRPGNQPDLAKDSLVRDLRSKGLWTLDWRIREAKPQAAKSSVKLSRFSRSRIFPQHATANLHAGVSGARPGVITPRFSRLTVCGRRTQTTQLKETRAASPIVPRLFLATASAHHFRCQEDNRVVARDVQAKCHVEEPNNPRSSRH
jgi:hypothetical protein